MIAKILVALSAILVALAVVVASRPSEFEITRSAIITAPAAVLFENVNNLHLWEAWSPWAKMDPNAKADFAGADSGVGAVMKWSGNQKVGEGSMTITASRPYERIEMRLDFLKPFKATNTAVFKFQPTGFGTQVTWSMSGKNNFISKMMSLFMNCDKMVGSEFEKGLATLKVITETK